MTTDAASAPRAADVESQPTNPAPAAPSSWKSWFYNDKEKRVKGVWRALWGTSWWLILLLLSSAALDSVSSKSSIGFLLERCIVAGLCALLYRYFFAPKVDKRTNPWHAIGLELHDSDWHRDLMVGLLTGGVLVALTAGACSGMGWAKLSRRNVLETEALPLALNVAVMLVAWIPHSIFEEAFLGRAYWIKNLTESWTGASVKGHEISERVAALLAAASGSVLFSVLHAGANGYSGVTFLTIFIAGLFLSYAYILTGSLGVSVGLHAAINFGFANVYGLKGVGNFHGRIYEMALTENSPDALTGGAFGFDGGLVLSFAIVLVGFPLLMVYIDAAHGDQALHKLMARWLPLGHLGHPTIDGIDEEPLSATEVADFGAGAATDSTPSSAPAGQTTA